MQYQADPTDRSPENGQKPLFWLFGSFKNAFLWHLNDPSWPGNVAECWNSLSTILMCIIKSIQQTKLRKMAKNLFLARWIIQKLHFSDFWMILHDLVRLPNPEKHLVPSQYTISSWSNRPKFQKWLKTSFWALWIIQKCIFVALDWPFMTWQRCQMLENIQYYHIMQYLANPTD